MENYLPEKRGKFEKFSGFYVIQQNMHKTRASVYTGC